MIDLKDRLRAARLYVCTDSRRRQGDLTEFLRSAIRGGVDVVQLREKGLEAREELQLLELVKEVAHEGGALFAVNDRADLAKISGADVLHLGQDDLTPAQARAIVGADMIIGRSTHDVEQGDEAARDPACDYYCVGPVWATPTKPGRPAAGLDAVAAAGQRAGKPWFAIGGIDTSARVAEVIAGGAERLVVVRAVTTAEDPEAAARTLRNSLPA